MLQEKDQQQSFVEPQLKKQFASLYLYIAKRLGIKTPPRVIFTHNPINAKKSFGLTAFYDQTEKLIRVYITNRHPTDILRSVAHELIHHWQNEHNALPPQKDGHEHYAQKNSDLRFREMEAFLLGSLLYRDFQDENRYGPPDTPPPLPPPYN